MMLRPPQPTRIDTRFPYTSRFRSHSLPRRPLRRAPARGLTPRRDGDGRHRVELPARDLVENLAAPAPVLNRPLDQDQQLVDGGKGAQAMTDDHDGRADRKSTRLNSSH